MEPLDKKVVIRELIELVGTIVVSIAIILIVYFSTLKGSYAGHKDNDTSISNYASDEDGKNENDILLDLANHLIKLDYEDYDVPNLIACSFNASKFTYSAYMSGEKSKVVHISFSLNIDNIDDTLKMISTLDSYNDINTNFDVVYYALDSKPSNARDLSTPRVEAYYKNKTDESILSDYSYKNNETSSFVTVVGDDLVNAPKELVSSKAVNSYLYKLLYWMTA